MTCQQCGQALLIPLQSQFTFDDSVQPIIIAESGAPKKTSGKKSKLPTAKKVLATATPPRKKRVPLNNTPSSSGGVPTGLIIGGVIVVLLAVIGLIVYNAGTAAETEKEEVHAATVAASEKARKEREAAANAAAAKANAVRAERERAEAAAKAPKEEVDVADIPVRAAEDAVVHARAEQLKILGGLQDPPPLIYETNKKLYLASPDLFPLLATPHYQVLAGGGIVDSGRLVLFGSGKFPLTGPSDPDPMFENIICWLAGKPDGITVAVNKDKPMLRALRAKFDERFNIIDAPGFISKAAQFDVLILNDTDKLTDFELSTTLPELLATGRGILATTGAFSHAAGRAFLSKRGFVVTDRAPEHSQVIVQSDLPMELNSLVALEQFKRIQTGTYKPTKDEERVLAAALIRTLQGVPPGDQTILPLYKEVTDRLGKDFRKIPVPMSLTDKVRIACFDAELRSKPVTEQEEHPASYLYPGRVSKLTAVREDAKVRVNLNVPYLNSTGYYAAPGDIVEIEIPESALGLGLVAQIGINMTITAPEDDWYRAPDICRYFPLRQTVTQIANPYGGPIYVSVPDKNGKTFPPPSSMAVIPKDNEVKNEFTVVDIRNAVKMARYVDGQHNSRDWEDFVATFMRNSNLLPPMLEIEAGAIILTLPTQAALEHVDRPEITTTIWEDILDECKVFTGRDFVAPFPIRVAIDAIRGSNNSAYPIDMPPNSVQRIVDRFESKRHPSNDVIGAMIYFFLGKSEDLPGKTEAMRMLFSAYLLECTSTYDRYDIDSTIAKDKLPELYTKILNSNYRWNTATIPEKILPYLMVVDEFGWLPLTDVVGEYGYMSDAEWPANEELLNADFAARLSKRVNLNLLPFFKVWGWRMPPQRDPAPLQPLGVYMPDNFPDSYLIIK